MFLRKFLNGRIAPLSIDDLGGGGGGGGAPAAETFTFAPDKPFAEQLPEKYRADASFRDIKSFGGLLDSFSNAQRMIGADKATILQMPKDDDAAGWDGIYNRLGRPESPDKYAIGPKKADGSDYGDADKAFQKEVFPILHKAGVTQRQLAAIIPAIDELAAKQSGENTRLATEYAAKQLDGLKKEWGAAYPDNLSDAQLAAKHLGGDELIAELNIVKDGKATGDNAVMLKALAKLGKQFREDGVIGKGGDQPGGGLSPADAKAAIKTLEANDEFKKVWLTKGAVGKVDGKDMTHEEAVKKMSELYGFAHPSEAAAA